MLEHKETLVRFMLEHFILLILLELQPLLLLLTEQMPVQLKIILLFTMFQMLFIQLKVLLKEPTIGTPL